MKFFKLYHANMSIFVLKQLYREEVKMSRLFRRLHKYATAQSTVLGLKYGSGRKWVNFRGEGEETVKVREIT